MSTKQFEPDIKQGYKHSVDELVHAVIAVSTNGTTAVNVLDGTGVSGAVLTVVGVQLVSMDTTAGNITVEAPAGTVIATIAKGTTAGACLGATSLANTVILQGITPIVKSSTAGNASVQIYFNNPSK